jgi:hypothetical protein
MVWRKQRPVRAPWDGSGLWGNMQGTSGPCFCRLSQITFVARNARVVGKGYEADT